MSDNIFDLSIPTLNNDITINYHPGERIYFVGANGSGKTRLAVFIENELGNKAHRIAEHRALTLNPDVSKISEKQARSLLQLGHGDNIQVQNSGKTPYSASEMSDGERSVFYLIGQTLVADLKTVLIFDEPEQHLHRAIMTRLWDELENARSDCAFITISHDLEFIANRYGKKYILKRYEDQKWDIQELPENNIFSEELTTLILGSRQPILFIEGTEKSLDLPIYRACYPDWTIISRNSCEEVIHASRHFK